MIFSGRLLRKVPQGSLVAEDLGYITPEVRAILDGFGLPGMRVLLFAFGSEYHAPHNHIERDFRLHGHP